MSVLPQSAAALDPKQARQVLLAAASGELDALGFPESQVGVLHAILEPVHQVDLAGNISVPVDVLYHPGTLVEAVTACSS